MTAPRPAPRSIVSAQYQNTQFARQSAVRIKAAANQILLDIAHGRLVRSSGRQIAADALALCEALAVLAAYEEMTARMTAAA